MTNFLQQLKIKYLFIIFLSAFIYLFLAEYVLAQTADVIGIRVVKNPERLSPATWYFRNVPNPGNPQALVVNGYPAIKEGRTIYVAAINVVKGKLYSNIYIFSYNEKASKATVDIFNQLLKTLQFNININDPIKLAQLRRDMKRISDLNDMRLALERYKNIHGKYPTLEQGTYVKNITFSTWSSWQSTLGNKLGLALPVDPLNRFVGCGKKGFDTKTCWNENEGKMACPDLAYVYAYRVEENGDKADLFASFEFDDGSGGTWKEGSFQAFAGDKCFSYKGGLSQVDYDEDGIVNSKDNCVYISNPDQKDIDQDGIGDVCDICINDANNDVDKDGYCFDQDNCPAIYNPEQKDMDQDGIGDACDLEICGNGKKEGNEECDGNDGVDPSKYEVCLKDCTIYVRKFCGDGIVQTPNENGEYEQCDTKGGGGTSKFDQYICTQSCQWTGGWCGNGKVDVPYEDCDGNKGKGTSKDDQYDCSNTCKWSGGWCGDGKVNGPSGAEECDGNIDKRNCKTEKGYKGVQMRRCLKSCTFDKWGICAPIESCGDGVIQDYAGEFCDDGVNNGKPGYCDIQCKEKVISWSSDADWLSGDGDTVLIQNNTVTINMDKAAQIKKTLYIWVANSADDSVTRIDVSNPLDKLTIAVGDNPSRTAVDLNNNLWVANRGVWGSGKNPDPQIDKDTGKDASTIYKISYDGYIKKKCPAPLGPRGVSVDVDGYIWVAGTWDGKVIKLSPDDNSCDPLEVIDLSKVIKNNNFLGTQTYLYGSVVDSLNNLWVVQGGQGVIKIKIDNQKHNSKVVGVFPAPGAYGIAVDGNDNIWIAGWASQQIMRFDQNGNRKDIPTVYTKENTQIKVGSRIHSRGIAVDALGHVWVTHSNVNRVSKFDLSGNLLGQYDTGNHPIGVTPDSSNNIWVVNYYGGGPQRKENGNGGTITKYSNDGNVIATYDVGNTPYSYSDMAGYTLRTFTTSMQGTWRKIYDSNLNNALWKRIEWQAVEFSNATVRIRFRTANDINSLESADWSGYYNTSPANINAQGRFIQIEALLRSEKTNNKPILSRLSVYFNNP